MNRKLIWILAILSLASLQLLASCKGGKGEEGTGTDTAGGTSAETEAATAIPRYDYIEAEVSPNVDIDRADYTNLTLTVPDSLRVEEDDVQAYIKGLLFQARTAVNGTAMSRIRL